MTLLELNLLVLIASCALGYGIAQVYMLIRLFRRIRREET